VHWERLSEIPSRSYQCGYCGNKVASNKGFPAMTSGRDFAGATYICPHCSRPSFLIGNTQVPGPKIGNDVKALPRQIELLYGEARSAATAGAHTASVLACRKLLMNIAVSQGAKENESFVSYVTFLETSGYVPPNGRGWVDQIRRKGNEATHEIALMGEADSRELITFAEMLLKFVYEFQSLVPKP
jgi:Domain of unknown function (DUF4145)